MWKVRTGVKSGFHCADFHETDNVMHFRGYLLYRTLSKAKAKYRKRGKIFIYSHKYTAIYTASIFTKLIMALREDLLHGIP